MGQVQLAAPPVVGVDSATPAARGSVRSRLSVRAGLIAGYVFLLPVQVPLGPDRRLAVSDLFILAYLLVTTFGLRRMKGAWSVWFPALLVVVGMGMLVSLATSRVVTSYALTQKAIGLVVLMLTMACLVDFFTSVERIRWTLRIFLAGVGLNVLVALAAYAVQRGNSEAFPQINYVGTRLAGLLIDPNAFGGIIACALMLHLFTARTDMAVVPARLRMLTTAIFAVGLVLTFSRSAWIAAAFGIAVAVLAVGQRATRAVVPLIAGVAVVVPVLATLYVPNLEALARRPDQVNDRFSLISQALSEFVHSPVWGIGLGVFPERHGEIVHNTAFWFLAEMGLIGLFVFVGLVVSFARSQLKLLRQPDRAVQTLALAALSAHAAMIGLSTGIESLYQRQWWLVFAVGGALATFRYARQR